MVAHALSVHVEVKMAQSADEGRGTHGLALRDERTTKLWHVVVTYGPVAQGMRGSTYGMIPRHHALAVCLQCNPACTLPVALLGKTRSEMPRCTPFRRLPCSIPRTHAIYISSSRLQCLATVGHQHRFLALPASRVPHHASACALPDFYLIRLLPIVALLRLHLPGKPHLTAVHADGFRHLVTTDFSNLKGSRLACQQQEHHADKMFHATSHYSPVRRT